MCSNGAGGSTIVGFQSWWTAYDHVGTALSLLTILRGFAGYRGGKAWFQQAAYRSDLDAVALGEFHAGSGTADGGERSAGNVQCHGKRLWIADRPPPVWRADLRPGDNEAVMAGKNPTGGIEAVAVEFHRLHSGVTQFFQYGDEGGCGDSGIGVVHQQFDPGAGNWQRAGQDSLDDCLTFGGFPSR